MTTIRPLRKAEEGIKLREDRIGVSKNTEDIPHTLTVCESL